MQSYEINQGKRKKAIKQVVKALEDDSNAFCEKAKEDDREMIKRSMPAFEKIYKKYNK